MEGYRRTMPWSKPSDCRTFALCPPTENAEGNVHNGLFVKRGVIFAEKVTTLAKP